MGLIKYCKDIWKLVPNIEYQKKYALVVIPLILLWLIITILTLMWFELFRYLFIIFFCKFDNSLRKKHLKE